MPELRVDPEVATRISRMIETGRYSDSDDVLRAALAYLEEWDTYDEWLQVETQKGLDELERGNSVLVTDLDAFFKMIKSRAKERDAAGIPIKDAGWL